MEQNQKDVADVCAEDLRWYEDNLRRLHDASIAESQRLSRYLITMSASAIGFSLPVITYFARTAEVRFVWVLVLAWVLFLVCICAILRLHQLSAAEYLNAAACLDQARKKGESPTDAMTHYLPFMNALDSKLKNCSQCAFLAFFAGICLLFVFVAVNLKKGS